VMIFLLFISLTGYFLIIARVCKWSVAVTPLFTVCLIPSLLYIAGIFNMLAIGAHLLFYMGIAFFVAYLLMCFKKRRISYAEIFNPGLILFVFYFVFLFLVCRSLYYNGWDEFSHWGLVTKDIVLNNRLTNLDSAVVLKSYPPGIALFHYFIVSIIGYSEGMVLFAHNLFLVSAFIPLFQAIKWKQFYSLILIFLISHSLFFVFGGLRTGSLTADPIVGTVFGMSIASYFLFEGNNVGRLVHLIPVLFFLPLTKQIGIYLALCACAIIVLDYFYCLFHREPAVGENSPKKPRSEGPFITRQKFPSIRNIILTVILSGIVLAAPLGSHFTWKERLKKYNIQEIFNTNFSLEKVKNTFSSDKHTVRDKETLINFVKALYKEPIVPGSKWMSTASFFIICLIMVIISILFQSTTLNRRRILLSQSGLIISFLTYCFIHLLLYLYSFGAYEGTRVASFSRYMGIFFLGWFYIFIGLFFAKPKQTDSPYGFPPLVFKVLFILFALVTLLSFKQLLFAKKSYPLYRSEVDQNMPVVNKYCPLNSRVFFIWQNDENQGLKKCVFGYEICPRKTNFWDWSLGKPYYEGDVWTTNYTPEQLLNVFSEYDYILIARADERFWKRYGVLFSGIGEASKGVLFKIIKTPGRKITIQRIE